MRSICAIIFLVLINFFLIFALQITNKYYTMRKIYFLLLAISIPWCIWANDDGTGNTNGNDEKTIPIKNADFMPEEQQLQIPVFHAEINSDCTILVSADRPTDFEVKILDANGLNVRYRGVTINDVLHITTQGFSEGRYTLQIETSECNYTGVFEISHSL